MIDITVQAQSLDHYQSQSDHPQPYYKNTSAVRYDKQALSGQQSLKSYPHHNQSVALLGVVPDLTLHPYAKIFDGSVTNNTRALY
jgi:hypothetical protein